MDHQLLPGFKRMMIPVKEGAVRTLIAGSGPPLLMLHGDPQTHLCWHNIAPHLTDKFTIVLTDIRGRGETHKPGASHDHRPCSKREMATEQVDVMRHLGFGRFSLIGHDRGARVARRMALDHPIAVERLGGCPRISIFIQIKVFWKNKRSHIGDIASIIFMKIT